MIVLCNKLQLIFKVFSHKEIKKDIAGRQFDIPVLEYVLGIWKA